MSPSLIARLQAFTSGTFVFQEGGYRAAMELFAEIRLAAPKYTDPRSLNRWEQRVYSQNGEDGIISEIFRRIGTTDRYFVEFGVEDGIETNTTYRLLLGWSGVWFEADADAVSRAKHRFGDAVSRGQLQVVHQHVTKEDAEALVRGAGVPDEFDLLSMDIDRNTYHLWDGLSALRPRVIVVEYNASIPATDEWVIPYDSERAWDQTVYMGASLKALERLGERLGYALVGCDLTGNNAFFVRLDLLGDHFLTPYTAEHHHEPPRYWLKWRRGHRPGFGD